MKIKIISFFTILAFSFFTGCDSKEAIESNDLVKPNAQVKEEEKLEFDFNLKRINTEDLNIHATQTKWEFEGLENKVILLNFFATWCPPCKAEIPHLNNLRAKYSNQFEIVAVEVGERDGSITDQTKLINFVKEYDVKYPVVNGESNADVFRSVSNLNRSGSIPFMILFNPQGEYVNHYIGMVPEEMLESDIKLALGK